MAIDHVIPEWGVMMSALHIALREGDASPGHLQIRANVPVGEREPEGWRTSLMAFGTDEESVPIGVARQILPSKQEMQWDAKTYNASGSIELRGTGRGLKFWLIVESPSGMKDPSKEQLEAATIDLNRLRDEIWT